jgi:3-dehydroquinate synthase
LPAEPAPIRRLFVMETIELNIADSGGDHRSRIEIAPGLLGRIGERARAALGEKPRASVIVTNPTVGAMYGKQTRRSLSKSGFRVEQFLIGDGERFKTLRTVESLYTFLIERGIERGDVIVALGGGVVGDLAGFAAATYLRGIKLVQAPTTLLAQIDSAIGGKTGVNHRLGKNLIGVFQQPALVVTDPDTLGTLPVRELKCGLSEAIKYGVIRDRLLFDRIVNHTDRLLACDTGELSRLITRSCQIKVDVVTQDEREGGLRRILNFGHTVGHALEALTGYRRFRHGEAVAHGMRAASRIAERMGIFAPDRRKAVDDAIARLGALPQAKSLAPDDIIASMRRDKKTEGGRIALVLPVEIGRVTIRSDVPLKTVRLSLRETLS